MQMRAGFLGLILHLQVQIVPGRFGKGAHQSPGRHLPPGAEAPEVAQKRRHCSCCARQSQSQAAQQRAPGPAALRHPVFQPAPHHPGGHNKGQHHKAHHMGAHHGKAADKAQRQLAQVAFPAAVRLQSRKQAYRPQQRQDSPHIPGRAGNGMIQIRRQVEQQHAQQHPPLALAAKDAQQRSIGRRGVENEHAQAGKAGLVVRIAHLTAGVHQAVAHVQLQRGKVAVTAEMAVSFIFFQQLAHVPVLAVALGQSQVFSRVAVIHHIHAGHEANQRRRQQNDQA